MLCGPNLQLGAVLLIKGPAGLGGPQIFLDRVHPFKPGRRHAERDTVVLQRLSLAQSAWTGETRHKLLRRYRKLSALSEYSRQMRWMAQLSLLLTYPRLFGSLSRLPRWTRSVFARTITVVVRFPAEQYYQHLTTTFSFAVGVSKLREEFIAVSGHTNSRNM